jgi:membrane protease YdiL (CAAX protease family)
MTLDLFRPLLALALSVGTALLFDRLMARRGFTPGLFVAQPWRRWAGLLVLAGILLLAVFLPAVSWGTEMPDLDPTSTNPALLFSTHALLVVSLVAWLFLAFGRLDGHVWQDQLGLRADHWGKELGLGLGAGVAAWAAVIAVMLIVAGVIYFVGGEEALPTAPPQMVGFIAGLPVLLRLAISVSAGVVEETFFRGFLQPRMGILLSTVLFALAHASYQAPLQLVAVTLLSLLYGLLVQWRRSIVAAIVAHVFFDAVQLLVLIPIALDQLPVVE